MISADGSVWAECVPLETEFESSVFELLNLINCIKIRNLNHII